MVSIVAGNGLDRCREWSRPLQGTVSTVPYFHAFLQTELIGNFLHRFDGKFDVFVKVYA